MSRPLIISELIQLATLAQGEDRIRMTRDEGWQLLGYILQLEQCAGEQAVEIRRLRVTAENAMVIAEAAGLNAERLQARLDAAGEIGLGITDKAMSA